MSGEGASSKRFQRGVMVAQTGQSDVCSVEQPFPPLLRPFFRKRVRRLAMNLAVILALMALQAAAMPRSRGCRSRSQELYRISLLPSVSDSLLQHSSYLIDKMGGRCTRGGVWALRGDTFVGVGSLARVFGVICRKADSEAGTRAFLSFRVEHWDSSDEDFAFELERLFVSRPACVLGWLQHARDHIRKQLLHDIAWGFINNRLYGLDDPCEDGARLPPDAHTPRPREVLNQHTYRTMFFRLHPDLEELARIYARDIDYLLELAGSFFKVWGGVR